MESVAEVLAQHTAQLRLLSAAGAGKGGAADVDVNGVGVARAFVGGATNYRSDSENGATYGGSTYVYGGYNGGEITGRAQFSDLALFRDTRVNKASLHLALYRTRTSTGQNFAPVKLRLCSSAGGHNSYTNYPSGIDVLVPATGSQNSNGRSSSFAVCTVQLSSDTITQIQSWGSLVMFLLYGSSSQGYYRVQVNNTSANFDKHGYGVANSTHLRWEYAAWSNTTVLA